ncbi:MAG: carbohydrate kinase [Thermotogae bacterium]|nr:carbohydrate kinase [Thermotogota bacterium]
MKSVLCAGEVLWDFQSRSCYEGLGKSSIFVKNPGGSPANVAVGLSKLGAEVTFLGKVGKDTFGVALVETLQRFGVDTSRMILANNMKTTLAFVAINEEGKPEYEFYRENAADTYLTIEEVKNLQVQDYSLFHTGSLALTRDPTASTLMKLYTRFHDEHILTSLDPNIRQGSWDDENRYITRLKTLCRMVDILKLNEADLYYITGEKEFEVALEKLADMRKEKITFITLGEKGSLVMKNHQIKQIEGFKVRVVDTTGCGDAYMAAVLARLHGRSILELRELRIDELEEIALFASAAASIAATRLGAMGTMPTLREIEEFLERR